MALKNSMLELDYVTFTEPAVSASTFMALKVGLQCNSWQKGEEI